MIEESTFHRRLKPLENLPADGLMLHEVYASVQGESTYAGVPCTFVRTTACHLRCSYCDTPHAFTQGSPWTLEAVVEEVKGLGISLVEITGGEPLLQENVYPLMTRLCDEGHTVLLETSGACDISGVDPRVVRIMDLKTPSSGELAANLWENLEHLTPKDEVKFVVGSREDYLWCREVLERYDLAKRATVLMGVVFSELEPRDLVEWIVEDRLPVRMQLQMHKYIWDAKERGV